MSEKISGIFFKLCWYRSITGLGYNECEVATGYQLQGVYCWKYQCGAQKENLAGDLQL